MVVLVDQPAKRDYRIDTTPSSAHIYSVHHREIDSTDNAHDNATSVAAQACSRCNAAGP
jgi:hypothetical protein